MADPMEREGRSDQTEARYANCFRIGFNQNEFILDVGQYYAEGEEARMHTRIVTSPAYALELLRVLDRSLEDYQQRFGRIAIA